MSRVRFSIGTWVRETAQALDRVGASVQGRYGYLEKLSRHRPVMDLLDRSPAVHVSAFVAPSASVIGSVSIAENASVWYGAVLRADLNNITIGPNSHIQDRAVIHVSSDENKPASIGARVTVGHGAVLHTPQIADGASIGMGAILADGVTVAANAMVAPGAAVPPNAQIGEKELWAGAPAAKVRDLNDDELQRMQHTNEVYVSLAATHAAENAKTWQQIEDEKLRRQLREERSPDYSSHTGTLGMEREMIETQAKLAEAER